MDRRSKSATSTKAHAQAAGRGALFAGCLMATLGVLWASTGTGPIVDFQGIGRTALAAARMIVAAPAQAAAPFITNASFASTSTGEPR